MLKLAVILTLVGIAVFNALFVIGMIGKEREVYKPSTAVSTTLWYAGEILAILFVGGIIFR